MLTVEQVREQQDLRRAAIATNFKSNVPVKEVLEHNGDVRVVYEQPINKSIGQTNNTIEKSVIESDILKAWGIIEKGFDPAADEIGMISKADKDKKQVKVKKVMDEWRSGKLKSSSGEKVTDRKQAIAIAMSEAGISKSEEEDCMKSIEKGDYSQPEDEQPNAMQ